MEIRIIIALAIIAGVTMIGTAWGAVMFRRRRRRQLRLRGIKTYGH